MKLAKKANPQRCVLRGLLYAIILKKDYNLFENLIHA